MTDVGSMVEAEHAALVAALDGIGHDEWQLPSLCPGWRTRELVAHLIDVAETAPIRRIAELVGARFSIDRVMQRGIDRTAAGRSDAQLLDEFRLCVHSQVASPDREVAWLGEIILHGEDIFRARGCHRPHRAEHVTTVAAFYARHNVVLGAKRRIEGVTLQATDTDWQHGHGPVAAGPAIALLLAIGGRKTALADLAGPGVALLATRG